MVVISAPCFEMRTSEINLHTENIKQHLQNLDKLFLLVWLW